MAKLLPLLLFLAVSAGCAQRITVIKATKQEGLGIQPPDSRDESNSSNPSYETYLGDGLILFRQGDFEGAHHMFERAIGVNVTGWRAHYYLGLTLNKKEEYSLSRRNLQSSLSFAPTNKRTRSLIYLAMAESWEKQGNWGQAKLNYIMALNLYPDSSPANDGLERVERLRQQTRR